MNSTTNVSIYNPNTFHVPPSSYLLTPWISTNCITSTNFTNPTTIISIYNPNTYHVPPPPFFPPTYFSFFPPNPQHLHSSTHSKTNITINPQNSTLHPPTQKHVSFNTVPTPSQQPTTPISSTSQQQSSTSTSSLTSQQHQSTANPTSTRIYNFTASSSIHPSQHS